ncbi:DJ-1/PfpI family protein [Actinomadura kijaniata]|uniref:DJ-1/PfpI family protein n=1 Tax=Actinomadura kijaniata TaxID=46161 RepID=UPI00082C0BA4|nr:DJ-1/PfpI family protein [Actinomadura kijaniata]
MTTYGLLIFEDVEELDFVGPWEVFGTSAALREAGDRTVLIAERPDPVRAVKGMRVLPDHTFDDHPPLDVLLVPGGDGRHQISPETLTWIAKTAAGTPWVTSVCTGSILLHQAGVAKNRRVATHHASEDELEARGDVTVVRGERWVVDGNLITSQGVSAGIDMSLWLVDHLHGRDHFKQVRGYMQYDPAPPYADE